MKPVNHLHRSSNLLCVLAGLMVPLTLPAQSLPGLPEPGLILYGRVLDSQTGQAVQANTVVCQITGNGDTANVSANAANFVGLNGQLFYVIQVPFETRLVGGLSFAKSPNTLALTAGNTPYSRTATVNGKAAAFKAPGAGQFVFGANERGRIDRLDLEVAGIPVIVPEPGLDLRLQANLRPALQNGVFAGITFEWGSASGKTYSIYRTSDLSKPFEKIGSVAATQAISSFTDAGATGPGPFFYRLSIDL